MVAAVSRSSHRILRALAPNRAAAWTIVVATIAETFLLTLIPRNIFECPGPTTIQVPLCLFAFWYVTVWLAWWLLSRVARSTERITPLRLLTSAAAYAAMFGLVLLHAAGWAMYFSTGQFGSVDALEFMLHNSGESWMVQYLWESEREYVVAAIIATGVLAFLLPKFLRALRDGRWAETADLTPRGARLLRLAVCLALLAAWTVVGEIRRADSSMIHGGLWADAVQRRLSPAVSLTLSAVRRVLSEPIAPVLDERSLVPLDSHAVANALDSTTKPPSVIFLAVESLRHDVVYLRHQGREVTPNLNRLATAGVQFTRAYTQSTHSDYADVCIVSSLYPLRKPRHFYYSASDPWPKTLFYDLLKPAGHATANISSQNEKWGCIDQFLDTPNLDLYYDPERSTAATRVDERDVGFAREVNSGALRGGSFDDSHTTDRAIEWIADQAASDRRFCLTMNFQSSHFPYAMAADCPRPFQPCELNFEASFTYWPPEKTPVVRNAYYNAVYECDRQLGRLLEALDRFEILDDVVLVVLGENGEAFYENGAICHAAAPMEPTVHVALVMHAPQYLQPRVEDYPTELIDVLPTVLGLWKQPPHPNFQGIDVLADNRPPVDRRTLYFHVENPLARSDALLHAGRWKLIRDRNRNVEALFDIIEDPSESTNLAAREPELAARLSETLTDWRQRQLAYYHYPQYYLRYFPPRPPQVPQ